MSTYSPHPYWEERLSRHFDLTGAGFAGLGPYYNAQMYQARLTALERGLGILKQSLQGARILEIGCGTGFYTGYCARAGVGAYVGVDITSVSVSRLREKYAQFRFVQADISGEAHEIETGFDLVLAADVLFHIVQDEGWRKAIQNVASRLRERGLLVVSDVFPSKTIQVSEHVRFRSLMDYHTELSKVGLRVVHVEPIFAILQPPPLIPDASWPWRIYAWLWRYGRRLAQWSMTDGLLPPVLAWLDQRFFIPKWGNQAPNSKWLFAIKDLCGPDSSRLTPSMP
jgi:SAM-dependent methyltransferase